MRDRATETDTHLQDGECEREEPNAHGKGGSPSFTASSIGTCLELPASPRACAIARRAVLAEAAKTSLSEQDLVDLELAVGEAVSNAVRHGSPGGTSDRVIVRVQCHEGAFIVEVRDCGQGFDRSHLQGRFPEQIRESGMGIFYMEQLMDETHFDSGEHGTTVRLVKRLPPQASAP